MCLGCDKVSCGWSVGNSYQNVQIVNFELYCTTVDRELMDFHLQTNLTQTLWTELYLCCWLPWLWLHSHSVMLWRQEEEESIEVMLCLTPEKEESIEVMHCKLLVNIRTASIEDIVCLFTEVTCRRQWKQIVDRSFRPWIYSQLISLPLGLSLQCWVENSRL